MSEREEKTETTTLTPVLDKAGWGCEHPLVPGLWLSDGYETSYEARFAADVALQKIKLGWTLAEAQKFATRIAIPC